MATGLCIVNRPRPGWGTTYGRPGEGPFPAVVVLHGSEGAWSGDSYFNAAILAAHGFRAMPLGYSTNTNLRNAGDIVDVPPDRTVRPLDALRACPAASGKVGLYGVSRGAEHALPVGSLMARDCLPGLPDAIAVYAAPDVASGAFHGATWRDRRGPGWQSCDPGEPARTWQGGFGLVSGDDPTAQGSAARERPDARGALSGGAGPHARWCRGKRAPLPDDRFPASQPSGCPGLI